MTSPRDIGIGWPSNAARTPPALEVIQTLEQLAFRHHAAARAEVDASWALVQALRQQR
ncbi:hypothetical protein [Nocardia sp. CA-119907]|uniref:hypothetical protein n=1 Tax=Nocardia sp. CA-119907 TaxID=3239973 RepID=UPI003D956DC6